MERDRLREKLAARPACSRFDGQYAPALAQLPAPQSLVTAASPTGRGFLVAKKVLAASAALLVRDLMRQRRTTDMKCVENGDGTVDGTGRPRKRNTRLSYNYVQPEMPTSTRLDEARRSAWRSVVTMVAELG